MRIESVIVIGIVCGVGYWIIRRVMSTPVTADPWSAEIAKSIQGPEALPVCHRCLTPQEHGGWFCPACGAAVGPYNNYMPFVNAFSEGEVFRAGTTEHIRPSFLVIAGYVLYSLLAYYFVFAPVYWYFLFRNFHRHQAANSIEHDTGP